MKKARDYDVNDKFLMEYEQAAIANAEELLNDAKTLLEQESFARTYFLSVASIEETGKAYIAFTSRGRDLNNSGLKNKLKELFETHSFKICSAFLGWAFAAPELKEALLVAVELMTDLRLGREASMYVDADPDGSIRMPSKLVGSSEAINSVEIATKCLHYTREYIKNNIPATTSAFDDKMLCLGTRKLQKVYEKKDFYEFLLAKLKTDASAFDYSKTIVTYYDAYLCKGKLFSTNIVSK